MISTDVVKVLDLVDSDDPVLAGESFVEGIERGAILRKLDASDSVQGLSGWEERIVVVV